MSVKALLFDCWGTLITYRTKGPVYIGEKILEYAENPRGVSKDTIVETWEDLINDYYGGRHPFESPAEALVTYLVGVLGLRPRLPMKEFVERTLGTRYNQTEVPGIRDMLAFLKEKDIPCAVASNTIFSSEMTEHFIAECLPTDQFKFVLASSAVGVCKPSPRFFTLASSLIGVKPEECCYIGDTFEKDVVGSYMSSYALPIWLTIEARAIPGEASPATDDIFYREAKTYRDAIEILKEYI